MSLKVLIADDEEGIREMLQRAMFAWSYKADYAPGSQEALMLIKMNNYDVILADKNMPGSKDGSEEGGMYLLKQARKLLPSAEVIIMTGYASLDTAIEAIRHGAFDYIEKPFQIEELKEIMDRIVEFKSFSNSKTAINLYREIFNQILKVAQTNYKSDEEALHEELRSILHKFSNFFKIQKNTEQAFRNIYTNIEKLKESILRTDPIYQFALNISKELDKQLKGVKNLKNSPAKS